MVTGTTWLASVAPITGPMYQLFIFFMVTDPKTAVGPKWAQCVVVFLVAFVEMLLRLNEVVYAPVLRAVPGGPVGAHRRGGHQISPAAGCDKASAGRS